MESNIPLQRATSSSAGYDFMSAVNTSIKPNTVMAIETGVKITIPKNYYMKIFTRSSMALYNRRINYKGVDIEYNNIIKMDSNAKINNILVSTILENGVLYTKEPIIAEAGVIDADYTGTIKILLHNMSGYNYDIKIGDKIAQGILMKYYTFDNEVIVKQDSFKHDGFGSSN